MLKNVWLKWSQTLRNHELQLISSIHACVHSFHFWPPGASPFLEDILGLTLGNSSTPPCSLNSFAQCSLLIIYSQCVRSGVSAFCLSDPSSVSTLSLPVLLHFTPTNYFIWFSLLSLSISSSSSLCFFQSHCVYPLFHLPSLLFRLPYCFGHTALLCCLSRERDNFLLRLPDSHHPAQ